jgi:hypothetical protein
MQLREDRARGNTHEFDELCPCRIKSADLLSKTRNKQILACAEVGCVALGKQCTQLVGVDTGATFELSEERGNLPRYCCETCVKKMHLGCVGDVLCGVKHAKKDTGHYNTLVQTVVVRHPV